MCENKFYMCEHCGNIVGMINDAGVPLMCCGQKMTKLIPGTVEASVEKHVPVVTVGCGFVTVAVGEIAHPMTAEHSILWVYLQTDKGGQRKCLEVGADPVVTFALADETPVAVYAYCNLHGLWKTEVEAVEEAAPVCDLKPVDTETNENYIVCKCNNVSYFDILDEIHRNSNIEDLLAVYEDVKNVTKCTTGCGGCYDKVLAIISEAISNK